MISVTANNVSIQGFIVKRSGTSPYDCAIFVDRSSSMDVRYNTITSNNDGISFFSSSNNVVSENTISSNNYDGIRLFSSDNNVVSENSIFSNGYNGISVYYSGNNVVSCNTITDNYYGIGLFSTSNNVVYGNTIANNYYGMYLTLYSSNNVVYFNNFNNTYQAQSDSANIWDDGDEGNYWSDYDGVDLHKGLHQNETGSDGIGDVPYEKMDKSNIDHYPLMGIFSVFSVTLDREMYHVTVICNLSISDFIFEVGPETGNKIVHFNVQDEDNKGGFCRIVIPNRLMSYPYIVLVGAEEIVPTLLDISNETYVYLYFTYVDSNQTVAIISSKMLHLYNELLNKHIKLQIDLYNLNATYYALLNNYSILLGNYSQLQESYRQLNDSYQEHLSDYSETTQNIRNLMQIFAATTAIFLITMIYLSKRAHASKTIIR